MKKQDNLEKHKCQMCPLKGQRPVFTKTIIISNMSPYEFRKMLEEIKMAKEFLEKDYNDQEEKYKIKVTCS